MAYSVLGHALYGLGQNGGTSSPSFDSSGANLLVLAVSSDNAVTLVAGDISDSTSNTYTRVGGTYTSGTVRINTFYCVNPNVSASHTFTVTKTNCYSEIAVIAASGAHASPLDLEDGGNSVVSPTSPATGITPSVDNCLVVSAFAESVNGGSVTGPAGYSTPDLGDSFNSIEFGLGLCYQIQTTATFTKPAWAETGSLSSATQVVSFKPSAGGGGATTRNLTLLGAG